MTRPHARLVRRRVVAVVIGLVLGVGSSLLLLSGAGLEPRTALRRARGRPAAHVPELHRTDGDAGYHPIPGKSFRHQTDEFDVTYRIDDDGGRRVPDGSPAGPRVDVYGDSWTFGHGVEDDETYAARLQARWPQTRVRNRGVMGFGTVHAMRVLARDLDRDGAPTLIVYGFNPIHVMRNHLRASHLLNVAGGRTPHYDVEGDALVARGWAGPEVAVADDAPGLLEAEWRRTVLFVEAMAAAAEERRARFVVVLLEGPDRLAGWAAMSQRLRVALEARAIEVVDLNREPDEEPAVYRYFDDDHPRPTWHAATARAIAEAVTEP